MSKTFWDSATRHFPSHDELATLDRDLRFRPAATEGKTFNSNQIEQYNREGYLLPFRVFDESSINNIRTHFDRWLEEAHKQSIDSYSIRSAHVKHRTVWDIVHEERILNYVADLIGEEFVCWGAHFFCKMPKDGKRVSWHQDASYWPLNPSKTVSVWLAIDAADRDNACMQFVAGSHLNGHIEFKKSEESEFNVLNQTVSDAERYGDKVANVELEPGEISLHSDLLLHGSGPNNSDRRRCGLTLRYAAIDVRTKFNWNSEGVVVRGSDPSGHWANPPRPEMD